MPITMPAKPDVAATQPAPKIGHLLGKGSLALIEEKEIEVWTPDGKVVARGNLRPNVYFDGRHPWSPRGDALLYTVDFKVLRVMDFTKGEDRLLFQAPLETTIHPHVWINDGQTILFDQAPFPQGAGLLWKINLDGSGLEQVHPKVPDLSDDDLRRPGTEMYVTDISADRRHVLLTIAKYQSPRPSKTEGVYLMDVRDWTAIKVSPPGLDYCSVGQFHADGQQVVMICHEPEQPETGPTNKGVYAVDLDGKNPRKLSASRDVGMGVFTGLTGGRLVQYEFSHLTGAVLTDRLTVVRPDGKATPLLKSDGRTFFRPLGVTRDGRGFLVLVHPRAAQSGVLRRIDVDTGKTETLAEGVKEAYYVR